MVLAAAVAASCSWSAVPFPSTDQVTACIRGIPFNASWRDGTLSTIRAILPSFVLEDILTNTGPPADIAVNLRETLDQIGLTEYPGDAEMWSALVQPFLSLRDAHTVLGKPQAYSNLAFSQPFKLMVRMEEGRQKIFLGGEALSGIWQEFGEDIAALSGSEVVSIDGVSPITAINDWASKYDFISLDQGARFNHAIQSSYMSRPISILDVPTEPMRYVVRSGNGAATPVNVPWQAAMIDPTGSIDISVAACLKTEEQALKHLAPFVTEQSEAASSLHATSEEWTLETTTPPLSMYTSNDGTTAVMKLTSFSPSNVSDYCTNMNEAWTLLADRRVDNLIIDVLGNQGGYVCLGYDLVRLLAPDELLEATPEVYGAPYDLKWVPQLSDGLRDGDPHNPAYHALGMDSWLDPKTLTPVNLTDFLDHGPTELRGDVADSRYSPRFFLDCEDLGFCELQRPNITFTKDRVLVLTDGTCGSTCSTFMHRLQAAGKYATVAGVGGIKLAPLVTSSFAGGFIGDLRTLNMLFSEKDQIQDFPTNGGLARFSWAEVYDAEYPWIPAQYAYRQPDIRLDFWDFQGPLDPLYNMAKATFPKLPLTVSV